MVVGVFGLAVVVGTVLLMLPVSRQHDRSTTWLQALFTATSAVCVTGLTVVDTATHWSPSGQVVVLLLAQIGGLGIMTLASVVVLALNRRFGMNARQFAEAERSAGSAGQVRPLLFAVVRYSLWFESIGAALLLIRFRFGYGLDWGDAAWNGLFHSVMAFNNAGFGLRSNNFVDFAGDVWMNVVVGVLVVCGGLGFPVLMELRRHLARREQRLALSLHSRVTLVASGGLLLFGTVALAAAEWSNARTIGPMSVPDKLLASAFQSVQTRTAGFNSIDIGAMNRGSWLLMCILMFIGGGSAGTAGGIKVTTFAIIGLMIWSELRGDGDVTVFRRRFPERAQRRAVAIAALSMGAVMIGGLAMVSLTTVDLDRSLFEVTSAFGTVGLSTGVTADLPASAQLMLVALMYLGRLGPLTLGAALVLRERTLRYRYPEEQPIIG